MKARRIITYTLVVILLCLLITGLVLGIIVLHDQNTFENEVEFLENGTTSDRLNVSINLLYPSKSVEYSTVFKSTVTQDYSVILSFYSEEDVALAKYVTATMEINNNEIDSGLLSEYLEGKTVEVNLPMTNDHSAIFTLRCTMPASVGDEAQNLTADFTMDITATPSDVADVNSSSGTGCGSVTTNSGDWMLIGLTLGMISVTTMIVSKRKSAR